MSMPESSKDSQMLFSPFPERRFRLQLRFSERRLLMMVGDALAVIAAIVISLVVWAIVGKHHFDLGFLVERSIWFVILPALWFLLASANDYYDLANASQRVESLQKLIIITVQMLVIYIIVFFLAERTALPRLFILYFAVVSFVFLAIWRILNPALLGWVSAPRRALVVGTDWAADTIIQTMLDYSGESYDLVGVIRTSDEAPPFIAGIPILGAGQDILGLVLREHITDLITTSTRELPGDVFQGVMDAYEHGVVITPMPILYERLTDRVPVEHVGDNWAVVLPLSGTSVFNPYPFLKRMMDIGLALFGLTVFLLMLPIIAAMIYLDSRGPIFYKQERVGLNGRIFWVYKLRSMIPDAEKATGPQFATKNDDRVTRVGRVMRKTRLDEIPQLWNVLKGDMSMIGPRPERPFHVERLQQKIPFYRTRHTIRPGLTGWAQVRYQYGATDEDALVKLQYDLYYIRHQSLLLDLGILLRTVGKVLRMSGQ